MESSKLTALLLILTLSVSSTPVALACGHACPTPSGHGGGITVPGIIGTVPGIVGGTIPGVVGGTVPGVVGGTVPGVVGGTVPGVVGGTVPGVVGKVPGYGSVPGVVGKVPGVIGKVPGVVGGGRVPGVVGKVPGIIGGGRVPGVVGKVPGIVGGTVPGVVGTVPGVSGKGGISISINVPGIGVGGVPGIVAGGSPKGAKGKGCPPPHAVAAKCPVDVLKLGACLDVLGQEAHIGDSTPRCCPMIEGLTGDSAAACLCTTIKARVHNQKAYVPLATQLLVACGKSVPAGYTCP